MPRRLVTYAAIAVLTIGGCSDSLAGHPVTTADQALVIAHDQLRGAPAGHGPFRVSRGDDGSWIVISGPPSAQMVVMIDSRTGKATTGFYQVAHINEPFDNAGQK